MNIIISNDGSPAHHFIRLGFFRAFQASGHKVKYWDIRNQSAFDAFGEFERNNGPVDFLWTQTYNINQGLAKCIAARPQMIVIAKAPDYGEYSSKIDLKNYPILVADEKHINFIKELKDKTGKPDLIHCHYHPRYIRATHGYWEEKVGVPIMALMSGADIFDYTNGTIREEFRCDAALVSGYWPYKGRNLDKFIKPLLHPARRYNIKIAGYSGWSCPQYIGSLPTELVRDLFASATINLSIKEPHSTDRNIGKDDKDNFVPGGFDITEKIFKLLANKCFVLSDYVQGEIDLLPDCFVVADCPEDYEDKLKYFLKYPEERIPFITKGYNEVMTKHTYFHRIAELFNKLNLPQFSEQATKSYENLING